MLGFDFDDVCCAGAQLLVAAWTCEAVSVATNAIMIYRTLLIGLWVLRYRD